MDQEHLDPETSDRIDDAFAITLEDAIKELPGIQLEPDEIEEFNKRQILNHDKESSIEDPNADTVLELLNEFDTDLNDLSWEELSRKILLKCSLFENALERAVLKTTEDNSKSNKIEPLKVFQILLLQIDELLRNIKSMLEHCCVVKTHQHEASQQDLSLSVTQSLYLFGTTFASLAVKSSQDIPKHYQRKLFKRPSYDETDSSELCDFEELSVPDTEPSKNEEKLSNDIKKKRSRQKFVKCDKCLKTWNDIRSFKVHQSEKGKCPGKPWFKVLPEKRYACIHPMCSNLAQQEFQNEAFYWNHVRECHWVQQDLVIDCLHCQEKFPLIEMMKYHVKLSHPKTKMCNFCGSVFGTKNDLAKHERTHTGEKPFACDKCAFRTSTVGTLKGHIKRRHEDPNLHRTFECTQCKKRFLSAYDLKQHILTHSDVKRYTCPACGKQLKNDSCYRRHMVKIHEQKFSCEVCNKDFSAQSGLNIHKRDVHGVMS